MALRVLDKRRGNIQENVDPNSQQLKAWEEIGVQFSPAVVPMECWTKEMKKQREQATLVMSQYNRDVRQDPYD